MTTPLHKEISSPFSKTNQHDQKYKTILSAASELFNIHGTRGTTLSQISEKLQLTKTSLYYYVKTKEELIHQCYLNTCVEMQDTVKIALSSDGLAINKLEVLFRLNFDSWNDIDNGNRGHLAALTEVGSLSAKHQQEIAEYYRLFVFQFINLIEEGQKDGSMQMVSAPKASNAILGAIFWLPVWLNPTANKDREDAFKQWLNIIKYGLNNHSTFFKFREISLEEEQSAPAGFNKAEQNLKKQEAFYRVGSTFFNQRGFKGTSLDDLAQSLGVTKGAFYYHIKNKEDLLIKCFERTIKIQKIVLDRTLQMQSSGIEKLAYSARKMFEIQVGEQGPLIRYTRLWSLDLKKRKQIEASISEVRDMFGDIIQLGIKDKTIKDVNLLIAENIIAGAIESVPDMALVYDQIDVNEASSDFFRIFFNGIAT
jgi:AcrR family transcriptional regulator